MDILKPGPIFLECLINNTFLARKTLYFGQLPRDSVPKNNTELLDFQKKIREKLIEDHRKCSDSALKDKKCFLDYFVICQKCSFEKGEYIFDGEIRAVFWKKYPLPLKLFIATGFRFSKGKHKLRIDLVNAATRNSFNVSSAIIEGSSECIVTPVIGDFVVKIPEAGIYFFNLYVDDEFFSSVVIPMETDQPKYSYSLLEEDIKEVTSGGLLILAKRSKSRD